MPRTIVLTPTTSNSTLEFGRFFVKQIEFLAVIKKLWPNLIYGGDNTASALRSGRPGDTSRAPLRAARSNALSACRPCGARRGSSQNPSSRIAQPPNRDTGECIWNSAIPKPPPNASWRCHPWRQAPPSLPPRGFRFRHFSRTAATARRKMSIAKCCPMRALQLKWDSTGRRAERPANPNAFPSRHSSRDVVPRAVPALGNKGGAARVLRLPTRRVHLPRPCPQHGPCSDVRHGQWREMPA